MITNLFQNMFKPFNFDVRNCPIPYLGLTQPLGAGIGTPDILLLREGKYKTCKKWRLESSYGNITLHKVLLGQKSEITFWQLFRISWLFILSTEPNVCRISVKIDFSVDCPDFGFFGLFLTGQYLSNYSSKLSPEQAFKKAQQPKTFFFLGHENFFSSNWPEIENFLYNPFTNI